MTIPTTSQTFALFVLVIYFLFIIILFLVIISSIRSFANVHNYPKRAVLFIGLAITSFAHTWYWMFHFMMWSFREFERTRSQTGTLKDTLLLRVANWLMETALFEQAWAAVCMRPLNWWWSEQLCLFTAGTFTVFLFTQRERVPHIWAYMLLGQMVAISVSWSLLNAALVLIPPHNTASKAGQTRLPVTLTIPVLLSLLTISLLPYTTSSTFLPNLLLMHALLILPLLPLQFFTSFPLLPRLTSFYTLVSLLSILLRIRTTLVVLSFLHVTSSPLFSLLYPIDALIILWKAPGMLYGAAWDTLHSHPAQASIGWDVVWSSLIWVAWCAVGDRGADENMGTVTDAALTLFPTAVSSVAVVAPIEFSRVLSRNETQDKTE